MTPKVTKVTQVNLIDQLGNPLTSFQVQYTVGADGPFSLIVPKKDFTAENVKAQMQAHADTLDALPRETTP